MSLYHYIIIYSDNVQWICIEIKYKYDEIGLMIDRGRWLKHTQEEGSVAPMPLPRLVVRGGYLEM